MIAWIGVGFALISSILFSCAAICLRREREKEEAVNMQYLMPGTYRILISGNFFFVLYGRVLANLCKSRILLSSLKIEQAIVRRSCHDQAAHPVAFVLPCLFYFFTRRCRLLVILWRFSWEGRGGWSGRDDPSNDTKARCHCLWSLIKKLRTEEAADGRELVGLLSILSSAVVFALFFFGGCASRVHWGVPNWSRDFLNGMLMFCVLWFLSAVYPQKQQYAYGYAYPGPYAYGSQYGPYNYWAQHDWSLLFDLLDGLFTNSFF